MTHFPFRRAAALFAAPLLFAGLSCKGTAVGVAVDTSVDETPAITSATPPPGPFNGTVTVTLTTNKPASLFLTTDGSYSHVESAARQTGQNKMVLTFTQTTTIKVFSMTPAGIEETMKTFPYVLAGGVIGTASGVIVVGSVAINELIGLELDGNVVQTFPGLTSPGQIPFTITGVTTGTHKLQAAADRNGDGMFTQVIDYFSPTVSFTINTDDPFTASVTGIQLLLGASTSGLCTIEGTITVPDAVTGQSVSVSAIASSALTSLVGGGGLQGGAPTGGSGSGGASGATGATGASGTTGASGATGATSATSGIQSLLTQLLNGYQVFAMGGSDVYPYAITNLQPGSYIVLPVLTNLAGGGIGINFLANPFSPIVCTAGAVIQADYAFGADGISGTVTLDPAMAPSGGGLLGNLVYGMVAARTVSTTEGIEAVIMPVFFTPGGGTGDYTANYSGAGLFEGDNYAVDAFTSLDPGSTTTTGTNPLTGGGPILAALEWVIDVVTPGNPDAAYTPSAANTPDDFTTQ